jgi:hypothetical protein
MKNLLPRLSIFVCTVLLFGIVAAPSVLASESTNSRIVPTQGEGKSCEVIEKSLQTKAAQLLKKATAYKGVFDNAALENEKNIDMDLLMAKKVAVEKAIAVAKSDIYKVTCPIESLKITMRQVEEDLQEVNKTLNDYRRTLRGLIGKSDKKAEQSPVLGMEIKKMSCTDTKLTAKKAAMTKIVVNAEKLEAKYVARSKVSGALSTAIVQTKRLSLDVALTKAKQDITALVCESGGTETGIRTFKADMKTVLSSLKGYRQALLDKSVDSQQTNLEKEMELLPVIE